MERWTLFVAAAGLAEAGEGIDIGWGTVALLPITFILFYLFAKYDHFELTMLHAPRRGGKAYLCAVTIFVILWAWAFLESGIL